MKVDLATDEVEMVLKGLEVLSDWLCGNDRDLKAVRSAKKVIEEAMEREGRV